MKLPLLLVLCMTGCASTPSIQHFGGDTSHDMYTVGPCGKNTATCSGLAYTMCHEGYKIIGHHGESRVITCLSEE